MVTMGSPPSPRSFTCNRKKSTSWPDVTDKARDCLESGSSVKSPRSVAVDGESFGSRLSGSHRGPSTVEEHEAHAHEATIAIMTIGAPRPNVATEAAQPEVAGFGGPPKIDAALRFSCLAFSLSA